jgi:PI-3-kinase-related kinase SMG-1
VSPLSNCAGLIQWVDGAVPMFSVYKQWYHAEVMAQRHMQYHAQLQQQQQQQASTPDTEPLRPPPPPDTTNVPPFRPSDAFYGKIIPALKAKGMTRVISRKDWPLEVQRQVLFELMAETPRNLLARELWASSGTSGEWWYKVQSHSRSVGVMSMIGHIIGLGDRHLDNILIDFRSGDVIHIDYNICFDKGLKLKVPELVPFRMTQVMQIALGLTGVDGAFRIACEQVMRVIRSNKETLLTLLEAFVYDPLVDWMADRADDLERRQIEMHVTLSLFASRIEEVKVPLDVSAERLLAVLSKVHGSVAIFLELNEQTSSLSSDSAAYVAQIQLLQAELALTCHQERETTQRIDDWIAKHGVAAQEHSRALTRLQELLMEWSMLQARHEQAKELIMTGQFMHPIVTDAQNCCLELLPAVGGLRRSLPEWLVAECQEMDGRVAQYFAERTHALSALANCVQAYATELQRHENRHKAKSSIYEIVNALQRLMTEPSAYSARAVKIVVSEARRVSQADECAMLELQLQNEIHEKLAELAEWQARFESVPLADLESECSARVEELQGFLSATFGVTSAPNEWSGEGAGRACLEQASLLLFSELHARLVHLGKLSTDISAREAPFGDLSSGAVTTDDGGEETWLLPELMQIVSRAKLLRGLSSDSMPFDFAPFDTVMAQAGKLWVDVQRIIFPEVFKALSCQDTSLHRLVSELNNVEQECWVVLQTWQALIQRRAEHSSFVHSYDAQKAAALQELSRLSRLHEHAKDALGWEDSQDFALKHDQQAQALAKLEKLWKDRFAIETRMAQEERELLRSFGRIEGRLIELTKVPSVSTRPSGETLLLSAFVQLFDRVHSADAALLDALQAHYSCDPLLVAAVASRNAAQNKPLLSVNKVMLIASMLSACQHYQDTLVSRSSPAAGGPVYVLRMRLKDFISTYLGQMVLPVLQVRAPGSVYQVAYQWHAAVVTSGCAADGP